MATTTRTAPITAKGTLDKKAGGKHWLKYDLPTDAGLMAVYVDARAIGLDKDEDKRAIPGSITVTVKFGR
jgi:hypothetical protein